MRPNNAFEYGRSQAALRAAARAVQRERSPDIRGMRGAAVRYFLNLVGFVVSVAGCDKTPARSLHDAAYEGDIQGIRASLAAGGDVNAINERGETALFLALGPHGTCEAATFLVSRGADVNRADNWGNTPLMNAAMWVSQPCVRLLLDKGAQVNARAEDGATAAMLVGNDGGPATLAVLSLLLERGADARIRTKEGRTVFGRMAGFQRQDVLDMLRSRGITE